MKPTPKPLGRPPKPYKTIRLSVPEPIADEIVRMIVDYEFIASAKLKKK